MLRRNSILLGLAALVMMASSSMAALAGFIKFKNGYFYDAATGESWVPHGIAYQTWNRPLGVWQTKAQIDYDLDEMVKMGANSIRVDFVWQHIEEDGDNQWKWDNYDYLVQAAEQRNIRIFALIGYQWPPNWFPDEWYTKHPPATDAEGIAHTNRWQSDIINYEHPLARAQYAEWFQNVCSRYKNSKAIVGWIIGNESGYLGLWSGLLDGYDPESEAAFRNWCQVKYATTSNMNARWGTAFTNFADVKFVEQFREYGVEGAIWADMVQWREDSIGSFTAVGAKAAKAADTNHLIAYSTVGMQWGEEDWRYHAEDRGKITQACEATNAPVDFFAVNNYPWSILGHESQNGQWGISYTKKVTISALKPEGVPVLYSETGFTSSETMWPGMNEYRQGPLVRNALWESLAAGAVGTHIFAWHDRPYITDREKGFGILTPERRIKPAFWDSANAFQLMEQARISSLLMGSKDPKPDIGFLWTAANDSQYNRYECEMQQIAGACERLGYEPNFVNLNDLASGNYTNYKIIVLPRNMRVDQVVPNSTNKPVLRFLRENVLTKGIHILASADLPGMQDENGRVRADFTNEMSLLFGIDASDVGGYEVPPRAGTFVGEYMRRINVSFTNALGPVTNGYKVTPAVWKYNDEIKVNSGTVWANMDTRRNKGFEDSATTPAQWGAWGNTAIQSGWGWQYSGNRMLQMWDDSGVYQEWDVVPFGRYTFSSYLRNNNDDPLRDGAGAYLQIEWYGKDGRYLGCSESAHLRTNTPGNAWVKYMIDDLAPSNSWTMRRLIRMGPDNLLANGQLTGSGLAPTGWSQWNDGSHDPCTTAFAGTSGNSWRFWWDGGIFQDITTGFAPGELIKFGGYLYTPGNDRLRNGTKYGTIQVEFYNGVTLISTATAGSIGWGTTNDVWTRAYTETTIPAGANRMRFIIRCNDFSSGDGAFMADDVFLKNGSRGSGSVYVDNLQENPALVVKNHGAAKAAIYLFSAGDTASDGSGDGEMDILPWKWRYDYFGSIVRDYFGVQPLLKLIGTNACYAMAEYRTCTNGATLWQVKNYLYDRFQANGGAPQTFTIQSSLFNGKTIRAFEQGRIISTNSNGTISLTLAPDGHEMLLAYAPGTNRKEIVQLSGSPSVVHPGGDKVHLVQAQYDCAGTANLKLKVAFKEVSNNGDSLTNEIYAIVTNAVSGSGKADVYLWIPTYRQNDPDYKSTPDGGKYEFAAWLENGSSVKVAQSIPRSAILEWGVRPTAAIPTNVTKGGTSTLPLEWEELYEPLYWQNTPMARNDGFPSRIGLFRSSKTESQFPGHFSRANEVANWLESLGYVAGNPLDISFDNIVASNGVLFKDDFEDGNYTGWTRAAGSANWAVETIPSTHGQAIRYDRYTTYTLDTTAKRVSYKITADAGKTIDRLYVYACRLGVCPTYSASLYKDLNGVPTGSPLFTQNFTAPTTTYTWVNIDVPNTAWSAGSTYHLVMGRVSGTVNATNSLRIQYVGLNTPDRRILYSTTSGSTWTTNYNYEPTFRIQYTDGTSFAQPYASYSAASMLKNTRYGQQFKLSESLYVTNLAVVLYKQSTVNGDARMHIRRWSDKAIMATSTLSRTLIPTTNNWVNFRFSSPVLLGATTQYFFEVFNLGTTGYYYCVRENTLGSYGAYTWDSTTNATVYSSNSGVTWSAQAHYDLGYRLTGYTKNKALRTWRIGNSDNLLASTGVYTNFTFSTDIRYNKQDNYFDDAEVYFHYKDRANYYRVGIRNYYAFWRLKYTVMAQSNIVAQGWLYDFAKTNRPVENTWYNLKIEANGLTNKVFFNGQHVGTFWATNNPSGKIAVGSRALQLGNWEPQKGYYFIDDDEWSFWAPEGQPQTQGKLVNLDPGYLNAFFNTMILPSAYVMSDIEVTNLKGWMTNAMNSVIVFDGGLAMKKETGASGLGRIESFLGVAAATRTMSSVTKTTVGSGDHYVTLDYAPGAQITAKGSGTAYTTMNGATALGTLQNATSSAPAFIANVLMNNPAAPVKVFCFNYPADTQGQLTNESRNIAKRAFEWTRGNAFKCKVALMYDTGGDPQYDFAVYTTNVWILSGSGSNTVTFTLPNDGIMTGTNLYWAYTVYPWDADSQWWANHQGFYSSEKDARVKLPGKGLQLIGQPTNAWAGREWELWLAYNTEGQQVVLTYGLKDKGQLLDEDNFDDGNYTGWTVAAHPNIAWSVTGGALRASVVSTGGYAFITRNGLALNNTNLTFEYYTRFMNGAKHGGAVYKGVVLYANPQQCGWSDNNQNYVTNGTGITTGKWHHVVVNIRDGVPMMRSDLIVDGKYIFIDEPIEVTSFATNNLGFLSPYKPGYAEWDNVRVSDEQYSFVTQRVSGVYYPTSSVSPHYSMVPDYDASMWEHSGSASGSRYEWYAYLAGQGLHDSKAVDVFFAPRIMDESTNFPAVFNPGQTVQLPLEWENLPELPMRVTMTLQDVWSGLVYATNTVNLTSATGSGLYPIQVPEQTPSSASYAWSAFIYPTNTAEPWPGRLGADDTFRYGRDGAAVEAEQAVIVSPVVGGDFMVYRDSGIPVGGEIYTWAGSAATFDGNYAGGTPPEGSKCFRTDCSSWAGWGVFSATGAVNMTEYRDGFIKFWLRSSATVKIDLEDWAGVKATKYVPTTSNAWKEITIPLSDFVGVNLAQIKGYFEITSDTATTFYIDYIRYVKGIFPVYRDAGIAAKCRVATTNGGVSLFNQTYTDGAAPEGAACFLTTGTTWAGWSVVSTNGAIDMSLYTNGFLCFWARSATGLKVEIEVPQGTTRTTTIPTTTNTWKEFRIPLTTFGAFNYAQVYSLFKITSTNAATFMVDDVSWKKGTNAVPSEKKETFYSDAGIPLGTDVSVWWANEYWTHLSSTLYDGGFESSTAGAFPNSGWWSRTGVGATATSQVSTAALRSGLKGLREQTDTATTSTWVSTFQEIQGYAGDIYNQSAYIRQPTGTTWVAGSTAFLRLQFLDAWRQVLTNVVSATKVTTAGQAWTLCSIPNTTAPYATRFVRYELVVQKPSGSAGVSVADFDDGWWGQGNSFYGQYAEDPINPEGTKCFRSYLVYWSGWGVFYTNAMATTNLSQYAGGYIKFWYKSAGVTKVEIMSVYNGVTNKAAYPSSGWFPSTRNEAGQVVWQQKSIPVSYFAGVDLAHIKSPFMVTDPTYDSAFYVDDVRWTMSP